ncbi:MAG: DegV family protein [Acholeplasmatales bacterium]|nr:DegV family protein [Acholeplasmatales bacterium]
MRKIFVDSGSSIKIDELEKYNVELIPLKILIGNKEYLDDGIDLPIDKFYELLASEKEFPKTSLPQLDSVEKRVKEYTDNGDEVIIITISSKISGTYNSFKLLFEDNKNVLVVDSMCAVGGIRLLVDMINRNSDKSFDELTKLIDEFIPHIQIMAIPETLHNLQKGGRLSKTEWLIGSILQIKPTIGFKDGRVRVLAKNRGLKKAMKDVVSKLNELDCDPNYDIIASYTYNKKNVMDLIDMTDEKYKSQIRVFDNLDPAVACHWGPNAFGFIFVSKK